MLLIVLSLYFIRKPLTKKPRVPLSLRFYSWMRVHGWRFPCFSRGHRTSVLIRHPWGEIFLALGGHVTCSLTCHVRKFIYLKGHLLVIPLLFKGKTIQILGTLLLPYELILSNIFMETSFRVFCG